MKFGIRRIPAKVDDRGATLFILAAIMSSLLGIAALAIDLVDFYAVRAQTQRAADAAALGGAQILYDSGCMNTSLGCQPGGPQEAPAIQRAQDLAAQNTIAGQTAQLSAADITFNYPNPQEPEITVLVARDAAHANAIPTVFGKIFGLNTVNISAAATAEAFDPSGMVCVKPWILPNCDPGHNSPQTNPNCPSGYAPFIDPTTHAIPNAGVIGERMVLKPGNGSSSVVPSQYYAVDMPIASGGSLLCPDCAGNGGTNNGGSLYRQNIQCCNPIPIACGNLPINLETGALQGPTQQGVSCLINEGNNGKGQDILVSASPLSITGGSNNPNPALRNATGLTQSSSIATVPLYPGYALSSGSTTVQVIGFLQVFVNSVDNQGNVTATILNISNCGYYNGTSSSSAIATSGGSVPVRLIRR